MIEWPDEVRRLLTLWVLLLLLLLRLGSSLVGFWFWVSVFDRRLLRTFWSLVNWLANFGS